MKIKIFTEIGIGNASFVSTEIEKGEQEKRVRGFVRMRVTDIYLRLWIGRIVHILSWRDGYIRVVKPRSCFKFLLGVGGVRRMQKKQPYKS